MPLNSMGSSELSDKDMKKIEELLKMIKKEPSTGYSKDFALKKVMEKFERRRLERGRGNKGISIYDIPKNNTSNPSYVLHQANQIHKRNLASERSGGWGSLLNRDIGDKCKELNFDN